MSPTSSPSPSPGGCTAPAWQSSKVYVGGDTVSHANHTWRAKWWTQNETPGQADVWADQGLCSGGPTASPSTSPTGSPSASPSPSSGTYPAWEANKAYAAGNRVSHGGRNYECRQAHTSLPGWEPPNVAALWLAIA